MKQIYLHIGLGKTGTTSIQKFLSIYYERLLSEGVHYVLAAGGESGDGHQSIAKSCIDDIPYYMDISDATAEIEQVKMEVSASKSEVLLLSAENFQLANPIKVKELLDSACDAYECRVILVVRSQDELLESEYNQMVKVKSITQNLMEYAKSSFNGDFMELASSWQSVFGDKSVISRVYNSAEKNAIADFLSCLPIRDAGYNRLCDLDTIVTNESLNIQQLSQQYIKNHGDRPDPPIVNDDETQPNHPAVLMNSEQARNFRGRFHASNLLFSSKFLDSPMCDLGGTRFSDLERNSYAAYWEKMRSKLASTT